MRTTLHYQVKDFKRFVLENLEKRGYILAAGTEPMMANMEDMDDPEQVVMEVLVDDRAETDFNQVSITQVSPAPLPASAQAVKKEKREPSEKELARRAKISERMKEFNSLKQPLAAVEPGQLVIDPELGFGEKVLTVIEELEKQEVVAPAQATFRTVDLIRESEGLLNGSTRQ